MKGAYDIKMDMFGPGDNGTVTERKILNRALRWESDEIAYEPDQRHAELLIKELDLESAKSVGAPGDAATAATAGDGMPAPSMHASSGCPAQSRHGRHHDRHWPGSAHH